MREELFEEDVTVANVLIDALHIIPEPRGLIILITLILLMNCVEFCMKEVFKCRERRMMNKMKNGQKLKLGDVPWTPQEIS